jgi:hypothetical protein
VVEVGDVVETDYLVVGAGAAGMAITDELLAHTDASVAIVDRRDAPGGHWRVVYPFVRLHQPSTYYGVSSLPLGHDEIDRSGLNEGYYERADADEICAYYSRVMEQHFLPSGRVRWFPCCEFDGSDGFVSRLTGTATRVVARRRIVDTTYVEGEFPATSPPPFEIADGVRWVPAGGISDIEEAPERYVIVGAGKTALDTIVHLLERGVGRDRICWIKPREGRWLNRRFQQPMALLPEMFRGNALLIEAMATAKTIEELFQRLEDVGVFLRIDPGEPATFLRGAIISEAELALLRSVEQVVRLGHVRRIEQERIVLAEGDVPTTPGSLHVHCAARGLARRPRRPIFEGSRMTVQPTMFGPGCYQFAFLGAAEAMLADDDERNRLCAPIVAWENDQEFLAAFLARMTVDASTARHPDLARWARSTRLSPASGFDACLDDPTVVEARAHVKRHAVRAVENLTRLVESTA